MKKKNSTKKMTLKQSFLSPKCCNTVTLLAKTRYRKLLQAKISHCYSNPKKNLKKKLAKTRYSEALGVRYVARQNASQKGDDHETK